MGKKHYVVTHIDGNKTNNNATNLKWVESGGRDIVEDESDFVEEGNRSNKDILIFMNEAFDKVWMMRNASHPDEKSTAEVRRILNSYDDIPKDGFTDWECGYWNGILGALRWVLGDHKNFLDT